MTGRLSKAWSVAALWFAGAIAAASSAGCSPSDDGGDPADIRTDRAGDADDGGGPDDARPPDVTPDTPSDYVPEVRPPDADNDGLPDDDEVSRGTDPYDDDTDDDGFTDGVEVVAGTDPTNADSFIPPTDFYVVLPYEDPEQWRELDFTARLGKGDIFFLVDTTGSMAAAINSVRNSLRTSIVPSVAAAIADVVMGVGDFRDFPVEPFGQAGDWSFMVRAPMTTDIDFVQAKLRELAAGGGGDTPEAQLEGLYGAVDGDCGAGGRFGAACFRTDSHPIIVVVTDAPAHNDASGSYDYDGSVTARDWAETMSLLNSRDVKIVGAAVKMTASLPSEARPDLLAAAEATGSYDSEGNPTVYGVVGGSVSGVVVDGIVDLVGAERQDVSARSLDDTSDSVDATLFIKEITPVRATSATSFDATTFYGVSGGTTITFGIRFQNDFRPHESHVQIYRAEIEVFDVVGGTVLDVRNVYVVVPAEGGILF